MREIKFRAWDKDPRGGMYNWDDHRHLVLGWISLEAPGVTLMQFTGLHDKNGKEIYEGDIAKDNFGLIKIFQIGEYFNGKRGAYGVYAESTDRSEFNLYDPKSINESEVIGNIYENPELIK